MADVTINLEGLNLTVRAAVSKTLPMLVLLGTDVPQLGALLHGNPTRIHSQGVEHALITTRAQARKQEEEEVLKKRTTAITKPLEGEWRDVEEGAIGEKGESEDEKMAEDGDSTEDGVTINGSGGVAEGVEVPWMMIFSYSQTRDNNQQDERRESPGRNIAWYEHWILARSKLRWKASR
jgi:hypothetical protein